MYGNTYIPNVYNPQPSLDRINDQINQLENMKKQLQQPQTPPTNLTQNFQLAPTNRDTIKYANSLEEVERDMVLGDTPYFSKDMSVLWVKKATGEVKTYELKEIVKKDEKDLQIEFLQAQIKELKEGTSNNAKSNDEYVNESTESKKSTNVSTNRTTKTK